MEAKGDVRRRLREARRRIVALRDLDADAADLARRVSPFVTELPAGATVLSYESLPHEPPTGGIHTLLLEAGHRVLVPITLPDWRLDWCRLDDPDRSPLGTDAPRSADLAVIPALAVDEAGTRLGQGGGCYDRVLPMLPAGTPVLTLLHPGEAGADPLPRHEHDVPVRTVVTAEGIHGDGAAEATPR